MLLVVIGAILLINGLIFTLLLFLVPELPSSALILIDSLLLILVLFPILYLAVFRPLAAQISLRERTARALRESEVRFRTLVAHAPVGILLTDSRGELTFVNQRWSELTGLPLAEAEGDGWLTRIHPEDSDRVGQAWRRAVDARLAFYAEFRFRWPDGRMVWVVGQSVPLQDEAEQVIGFIGSFTDVTERARAIEALRRSEAQLARAQKLAHLGSYEIDGQRHTLFWSEELYRITGRDPALGEPTIDEYYEMVHPEDRERVRQNIHRILETGQPFDYEYRIIRPDGEVRCLHSVGEASRDAFGKVAKIYGTLHDITERKQAEEQMQQATHTAQLERRRWQTTVESMPDLVMIADDNGRTIYVNPAFHRLIGYPARPDLPLRDYPDFYQAYLPEGELFPWDELPLQRAALRNEALRDIEVIQISPGGERHITIWNASPLHDPTGKLFGAVAIGRDVTAQRQVEEEREHLLAELNATFASLADGLMVFDPGATVVRANSTAEAIFNLSEGELPLSVTELAAKERTETPDGQPYPYEAFPALRALKGERVVGEIMVIHPTPEQTTWVSTTSAPIRSAGGHIWGAVSTYTDITALHELQEQQEVLLHSVSHDLRIPLTIINGHAQLLESLREEADVDGGMQQSIEAILLGTHRMNVMIADLVDAARQESHQLQLRIAPVDLQAFLQDLLQRSRAVLEVNRIILDFPSNLPPVLADSNRLERIFLNLLSNALKYSSPGTPVDVKARQTDGEVEVSVRDVGIGIAPEDLPHLFERFYRGKGEHKTEGLGLGLFITRMLVEAHGGRIRAESEPGQGSAFIFTLPIVDK
ncbi:MAG: PAS domain-containing sensor histidine kinase [Armatimonadota bacterium]